MRQVARVMKEGGETTEWMRTLLLPELRAIGQEATLITPTIAFNTGYKIMVNLDGSEAKTIYTDTVAPYPTYLALDPAKSAR